ncbi:hypothetical protein C8F04DRAFT_1082777 [Mycena alexandri]|uniref:DNA mismatch repair protein PMS1 n=1 Tax=Mycena alexandri TaxID=1745969 RepID=A0AAD6X9R1_9AGAR|nr:hypothetical protein C8F04DRAFT_1082777 [Mycena alexandri]
MSIKPIDKTSIHRITSGQVVIDLQTAVKELVENSLDAGATNLEVRFKQYGLSSIEVMDNGGGISEENYEGLALKNHTSKLSSFADLTTVTTFGFRGEALSSLCALCESVVVSTATRPPMGVTLEMESSGKIRHKGKVARQRGTTITLTNLFSTLPVRRKEFERNAKREFGKALTLLNAYALGPCSSENGVRLTVSNQADKGAKSVQIRTPGTPSLRESVSALWGPKALENLVPLALRFPVERDKVAMKRAPDSGNAPIQVEVRGLVSKFAVGYGRSGTDRQFFYVNGRPCNISKVQKAFNEVYRSFNATQSPFLVADFILPTANLISALKLKSTFASSRSTYDVEGTQSKAMTQTLLPESQSVNRRSSSSTAVVVEPDEEVETQDITSAAEVEIQPVGRPLKTPQTRRNTEPKDDKSPSAVVASTPSLTIARETRVDTLIQYAGNSPFLLPVAASGQPTHDSPSAGASKPTSVIYVPRPSSSSPSTASNSPIEDVVVTLDSSSASWQRKVQLTRKVSDERASSPVPAGERHDPPRKKRRSEPSGGGSPDEDLDLGREVPNVPVASQVKSARQNLRTMLVGFSAAGSQPVVRVEVEEDDLEASDDDESMVSPPRRPSPDSEDTQPVSGSEDDDGMQVDARASVDHSAKLAGALRTSDEDVPDVQMQDNSDAPDVTSSMVDSSHVNGEDEDGIVLIQADADKSNSNPSLVASSIIDLTDDDMFESSDLSIIVPETSLSATPSLDEVVSRPEVIRTPGGGRGDVSLRFEVSKVSTSLGYLLLHARITDAVSDDVATEALARTISKEDFGSMDILGQFNLGFIVTRRRTGEGATLMDDLFIVDQHAADEKYNFETLQQTTRIRSQKLSGASQPLELTAGDELVALENIEVLRQNGFEVDLQTAADDTPVQGPRLSLTAQPVSKDTVFDMKDLEELIHRMRDQPAGQMVRCSKARAMFAMRACRKSVMIGMPLTKGQMTGVVRHMGTMDQPWNCPHGRPTMRHLADILGERDRRSVNWGGFGNDQ